MFREADLRRHLINEVKVDNAVLEEDTKPDPRFAATPEQLKKQGIDDFQLDYALQDDRAARRPQAAATVAARSDSAMRKRRTARTGATAIALLAAAPRCSPARWARNIIGGLYPVRDVPLAALAALCRDRRSRSLAFVAAATAARGSLSCCSPAVLDRRLSGAIGVFHAGVEYHWWQGFTACTREPAAGRSAATARRRSWTRRSSAATRRNGRCSASRSPGFNAIFSLGGAIAIFALCRAEARR